MLLTYLHLLYPNMELIMSSVIIVCIFPHEEFIGDQGYDFSLQFWCNLTTSQVVKFYIKAIFGFLAIPDYTGASCDHSFSSPARVKSPPTPPRFSFLPNNSINIRPTQRQLLVFQGFHQASWDTLPSKMNFVFYFF